MRKVHLSTELQATADEVWNLVGGFHALPDWHPAVQKSELERGGVMRRLSLLGGGSIVERLERFSNDERVYTYSIIDAPLPVRNYVATLRVAEGPGGKGSTVHWSSEFETAPGVLDEEAEKTIAGVFQSGLDNLKQLFQLK